MAAGQQEFERQLLEALRSTREPSGKDVVEAGIVLGAAGEGDGLKISCRDPGWPDPIRERITRSIQAAVSSQFPQLEKVEVAWQAGQSPPTPGAGTAPGAPAAPVSPPGLKHVIAVGSGKGGVGKSTVAASLAYALKHRGHSVGLMDADVYGPSIPHMLGLSGRPAIVQDKYEPLEVDGIKVISMGFLVPANQAVVWRGPMLHKAVRDFLFLVRWGELDYLVVDLPPGTGDVVLSLSQQIPTTGAVIVCTPQDVALLDARKALHMFQTVRIPCLGVVENMSFFLCPHCGERSEIFGCGGARKWAEEMNVPFLGGVPINLQVRLNGDTGQLGENFATDNPARGQFLEIADRLIGSLETHGAAGVPTLEIVG